MPISEFYPVVGTSGPLIVRHMANGKPRLQGVFRLQDQEGFPVDMSYEEAKKNGIEIDWVEALVDAGRQGIEKYDSLCGQIALLIGDDQTRAVTRIFASAFMEFKPPVDDGSYFFPETCKKIYEHMHSTTNQETK